MKRIGFCKETGLFYAVQDEPQRHPCSFFVPESSYRESGPCKNNGSNLLQLHGRNYWFCGIHSNCLVNAHHEGNLSVQAIINQLEIR